MKKLILFFFLSALFSGFCKAQDFSLYKKSWLVQGSDTLPYRLLLPENYDPLKKYPLVFFLHGAGERGDNNQSQLTHGAALFLKESVREKFPAIGVRLPGFTTVSHLFLFTFPQTAHQQKIWNCFPYCYGM